MNYFGCQKSWQKSNVVTVTPNGGANAGGVG